MAGETRGCLFCRKADGGFTTKEHVFPESLGNTELILHPGVVCDRCNNETLSKLDKVICEFMPVSIRRTMLGIRSKAGKVPGIRFSEGTVDFRPAEDGADPTLVINASSKRSILTETEHLPDGRVRLEWKSSGGRRMTPRYASELSRALLKSALECSWLDHGEMMLEARFDHIREAVLGTLRGGFFVMAGKADPDCQNVSLTYQLLPYENETWRMLVMANYYGVTIGTDSRLAGPLEQPPEDLFSIIAFTPSDLRVA